jgi:hypothetical protein
MALIGLAMAVLAATPCLAAHATAQIGATICPALAVTTIKGLDFGQIAPEATGNVVVSSVGVRTASAGVRLLSGGDTKFAAVFAVSGADGASYSVGLPGSVSITAGSHSMTASNFSCSPVGTQAGGSGELQVGATLAFGANQAPGQYTGWFDVIVNYN